MGKNCNWNGEISFQHNYAETCLKNAIAENDNDANFSDKIRNITIKPNKMIEWAYEKHSTFLMLRQSVIKSKSVLKLTFLNAEKTNVHAS